MSQRLLPLSKGHEKQISSGGHLQRSARRCVPGWSGVFDKDQRTHLVEDPALLGGFCRRSLEFMFCDAVSSGSKVVKPGKVSALACCQRAVKRSSLWRKGQCARDVG